MENNSKNDDNGVGAQKTRCLQKIAELVKRLEEQKSQYPSSCVNYLKILNGIEKVVSKTSSRSTLDKCEDELNRYWNVQIIPNFSTAIEGESLPHSRSPDSTAAYGNSGNTTSESGRYVYDHRKANNTSDYHPDSTTLIEAPSGDSSNHPNVPDADSEVSSSQESIKINSPHVPDNTFPSLYSRRKEIDDPVAMIMQTVKNRLRHDNMLNQTTYSNYGMSSSEEIERYEGSLKSQFFENVVREPPDPNKLSSMLERMMDRRDSSSDRRESSSDRRESSSDRRESSSDRHESSLNSEKVETPIVNSEQKSEKPLSLRAKMAQDIGTLHKAGESNKIKASLKQLKSDVNLSNSSPSSKLDPPTSRSDDRLSMPSPKDTDDYRSTRAPEFRRYSDRHPHSPRSPLLYSRSSSRESPHTYFSPKDSPDDYHRSDRRRISRSRSRERHRDQYSEKSSSKKTSPKKSANATSQSTSYNSFVNSIGYGRCPPNETKDDESRTKEDKNKNDVDGSKPNNLNLKKKNFAKFKVNTNLSESKIEQNVEDSPAEVEQTTTANNSDMSISPAHSESSSSSGVLSTSDPRLSKVNNYSEKRDEFTKVTPVDPRLQNQSNKASDPRLGRYSFQKTGVPKDPRAPPSANTTTTKGRDQFRPPQKTGIPKDPRLPPSPSSTVARGKDEFHPFQKTVIPKDPRPPPPVNTSVTRGNNEIHPFQKSGIPKDPRPLPPASATVTKGSDEFRSRIAIQPPEVTNVPRTPDATFSKDLRTPAATMLPVNKEINDKFHPKSGMQPPESNFSKGPRNLSSLINIIPQENITSHPSPAPAPDRPRQPPPKPKWQQNKFGTSSSKPLIERKKTPNQNVFRETKPPKPRTSTDIKQQVKNSNEFLSPLQDIFQSNEVPKTGRGYGNQKLKTNVQKQALKKFTIPKIKKQSDDNNKVAKVTKDDDWNDMLNSAMAENLNESSSAKVSKKKFFHEDDDENWDSAISGNDNAKKAATTTQVASSLPSGNIASNVNENRRESTDSVPMDTATIDDDEECWNPVDSPEAPATITETSNTTAKTTQKQPVTIEINAAETTQKEPVTIEIDDIEDLTQDKNCDEVIVIDDADKPSNVGKDSADDCIRSRTSSNVRIDEVYLLESNDSNASTPIRNRAGDDDEPEVMEISDGPSSQEQPVEQNGARSTSTSDLPIQNTDSTEKTPSSVTEASKDPSPPAAEDSNESTDELLMTKVLNYLKSIPNPPEILEKDVKLSPNEFIIKLFPKMSLETFKAVQDIIASHEDPNRNDESEEAPVVDEVSEQPTDIEMKPVKPGRGKRKRKRKKNDNTKPEADLKTIPEPKSTTTSNRRGRGRRRNRELDRLHADIEKLRETKNNVMDIGATRRCRLQPANYTDTKIYNKKSGEEWMNHSSLNLVQFENELNKGTKAAIRRTRSKADLGSDSDSVTSTKKFKSRQFIVSDTSSDDDSEKEVPASSTHDDIRKYKACPRLKKIERFGSECYEQFEKTELRKDLAHMKKIHCPKDPIPVLPKIPNTCDNFASCLCHSKVPSHNVTPEYNEPIKIDRVASIFSKIVNEKPVKVQARTFIRSPQKRKAKPGKTSKLRMKMSKNVHFPNWQVVENQKCAEQKNKTNKNNATTSDTTTEPANIPASDSRVSQPTSECVDDSLTTTKNNEVLENEEDTDDDINDDLKALPPFNAFKNPDVTSIEIATIGVRLDSTLVYVCKTDQCSYESNKIDMFALHLQFLHKLCKINDTCKLCGNARRYLNLKSAFRHLLQEHLKFIPDLVPPPTSTDVEIKDEPVDQTSTNPIPDEDSTNEDCVVTEPVVPAFQSIPVVAELPAFQPETVSTPPPCVNSPEIVISSTQSSPVVKNPCKIRVRRLSGDKLSGPETSSDSQRSTPEIRNIPAQAPSSQSELCNLLKNNSNLAVNLEKDAISAGSDVEQSVDVNRMETGDSILSNDVTELDLPYKYTKAELNLIQFYKCPDKKCGFSSDHKKEFLQHVHNVHKGPKRSKKFDPAFLTCRYCGKKFDTPEMLVVHMEKYENCKFQCAYCEFRASRPVYLLWHLNACHFGQTIKILVSSLDDNKDDIIARSEAEKDLKEVIAPITCVHCDQFQTISFVEYRNHWKKNHSQTDSVVCDLCKSRYFSLDLAVKHLTSHGYGEFQCVYCIHGVASEEAIKSHLLKEHYTLYPKAVKRITPSDSETANKFDDYIEMLDLDKPLNELQRHFRVVNKNIASEVVTLHAETPDGTISATVNLNEGSDSAGDSNYEDIIAVYSSDDDTNDRLVINEDAPAASSSKTISKPTYASGLSGTALYKCGFIGCTAAFETYVPFKEHLSICDNARNRTSPKCPHCNRTFQKNAAFLTHVGLHGVPRYICSLCDTRFPTAKKGEDHIKQIHKVNTFKVIPANPLKDNSHEDLYIVLPNSEKGGGKGTKQFKKFTDSKNLPSTSTVTTAKSKEAADIPAKQITTVYSLRDVEEYLPMQLFSEPVTCGICSTYNSKVRQNIIVHLQDHSTGLVPVNDITNPVPCTDKSELMFNKMTNHAAFSAKADDRKIKCLIEKMEAYSGDKNEIIPSFIPKTFRYSCGAPDCVYRSTDAHRLKIHFETLHSELDFNCPHCGRVIPVDMIHKHLKYHDGQLYKCYYCTKLHYTRAFIETHQQESHPDSKSLVQVIRELTEEEIEELSREARYPSDGQYYRSPVTYSKASIWKCNLCKSYPMMSEELVKSHCLTQHRVGQQFKCGLCGFANSDKSQVNTHMNEEHGSVSQVIVTIYKEITENDESSQSSSTASSPSRARNTSLSITSDRQLNLGNLFERSTASKPKNDDSSRSEIDDIQNSEISGLLIMPLSNNRYICPFCNEYNTADRKRMREHLYQEKKYERYGCYECGTQCYTEDEIKKHAESAHGGKINIGKFSEDEVFEKQVEQILDYQQSKFTPLNEEGSIEISSGEEEDEGNVSRISGRDISSTGERSARGSVLLEFSCPHCPKKCMNSAGLKNHINYVHRKKQRRNKPQPQPQLLTPAPIVPKPPTKISPVSVTIFPNVNGIYPCKYCNQEFSAKTITQHVLNCPNYRKSSEVSPTKVGEIKVLTSDRVLACSYCGKRCNPLDLDDHIAYCKSQQLHRFQRKISCVTCGLEADDQESTEKHIKCKHQPMECLNCDKILMGSDELDNHVHESLINISGSNQTCIARDKEVVIMCPYCPTGLIGQSYDKYTYISDHIEKKHTTVRRPTKNIRVKIKDTVRELMDSEIALMQSKFNKEQVMNSMPAPSEKKKKRNVAVKSTARPSSVNIVNYDNRMVTTARLQRISDDFSLSDDDEGIRSAHPVPKINIIYKGSKR